MRSARIVSGTRPWPTSEEVAATYHALRRNTGSLQATSSHEPRDDGPGRPVAHQLAFRLADLCFADRGVNRIALQDRVVGSEHDPVGAKSLHGQLQRARPKRSTVVVQQP